MRPLTSACNIVFIVTKHFFAGHYCFHNTKHVFCFTGVFIIFGSILMLRVHVIPYSSDDDDKENDNVVVCVFLGMGRSALPTLDAAERLSSVWVDAPVDFRID